MKMLVSVFLFCIFSSHLVRLSFGDVYRPTHQCPDLELISLGRVMPYRSDSDYRPPVIGDIATYRCVQGYGVAGDITRTCVLTINGTAEWNGTEPHCKILDCGDPGAPLHGRRHGSRFRYTDKVWFSCHHLTTLVGTRTISCNEHGKWSNPRPICRKHGSDGSCPPLQLVQNGQMAGGKKVGEKMWFICNYGYTMIGSNNIQCQLNATWSGDPPVCALICTNPPAITNGRADATFAAINDTIDYSCAECYEMEEFIEVKCLPNRTWSRPLPSCKRIACENPMNPGLDKRNHQFLCGAEMTFECAEGYRMVGSSRMLCMETGNWSNHMPNCEYAPEIGNCPELIPPINGSIAYSINDTHVIAEYSCHTGYSLNGDIRRYCNDTGVWDGASTSCVDDDTSKCQFLDAPTNGFVVIGGFQHGNNVTYFCNADYVLMHGDHVRQCMTDGQWSGSAPSCEEVVPVCQSPDDILNARYTVSMPASRTIDSDQLHNNVVVIGGVIRNTTNITSSEETALMFLLGSVANFYCDDGYVMAGRSTLMCFPNGSWVGAIGGCARVRCAQPKEYKNSYVIPSGDLSIGSTANYHCYHGFFPTSNSSMTITCQGNGEWTELDGDCSPAVCQYPEVKDDVIVTGKGFTYASKGVRLKCISPQARQIRGNKRSKCLADSTWSIQNFNCSNGQCPVDINFELCNSTDFAIIGTVKRVKKADVLVAVERTLYQSLSTNARLLKILLADPILSITETCCQRISVNSTYIFAGNYKLNDNKLKYVANGCKTVYSLTTMNNTMVDVHNVQHSFLQQCQFRILASSI